MLVLAVIMLPFSISISSDFASDTASTNIKTVTSTTLDKAGYSKCDFVTKGSPFLENAGGSKLFRIPAMITLQDGTLLACADARYETTGDGGGLDTIIATSADNGQTWNHSYAIRYPDSKGYAGVKATTCIDPAVIQGADGTIYIIADMNPTGVTTMGGYTSPNIGTGYMEINGVDRLALTDNYSIVNTNPKDKAYPYYLGDINEDGFATVYKTSDNSATKWVLDSWWNIYENKDGVLTELSQKQVDSEDFIQQNAYYKDSVLHVYNTGYLLMVSSKDNGATWTPRVLNTQIKRDNEKALLVSPGKGTLTSDGTIIIPFYTFDRNGKKISQQASFIWSKDNGTSWHRTESVPNTMMIKFTSESEMIELDDGTLRMFVRNGRNKIVYTDAIWDKNINNYLWTFPEETIVDVWSNCNVSAIKLSKKIDGKTAIMVACPSTKSRINGKIYTFLVDDNNTLIPTYEYAVNTGDYAYSCMDELKDGSIGLLYEAVPGTMKYINITVDKLTKNAYVSNAGTIALIASLSILGAVAVVGIIVKIILTKKK